MCLVQQRLAKSQSVCSPPSLTEADRSASFKQSCWKTFNQLPISAFCQWRCPHCQNTMAKQRGLLHLPCVCACRDLFFCLFVCLLSPLSDKTSEILWKGQERMRKWQKSCLVSQEGVKMAEILSIRKEVRKGLLCNVKMY